MSDDAGNSGAVGGMPNPQAQIVLQVMLTMTADGNMHVGPGPQSPRQPTLEDVFAFACRMKRDVEIQMIATTIAAAQAQAIGRLMKRTTAAQGDAP